MKKVLFALITVFSLSTFAQEQKTWRLGLQWGAQGNKSQFSGGMKDANARFQQKEFGAGAFDIIGRYDFNNHWMVMTGLGFNSFGFEYAIAENYSFLQKSPRYSDLKSEFSYAEIPLLGFYKFNPNCKNSKWLIGGGFASAFVGAQTKDDSFTKGNEGVTKSNYLNSTSVVKGGNYAMIRFVIAREKVFKKGGILNASMIFNAGLGGEIAKSTVVYTIDNQEYSHQFSNRGNFVGFRLAYFFKPLHLKANKK